MALHNFLFFVALSNIWPLTILSSCFTILILIRGLLLPLPLLPSIYAVSVKFLQNLYFLIL